MVYPHPFRAWVWSSLDLGIPHELPVRTSMSILPPIPPPENFLRPSFICGDSPRLSTGCFSLDTPSLQFRATISRFHTRYRCSLHELLLFRASSEIGSCAQHSFCLWSHPSEYIVPSFPPNQSDFSFPLDSEKSIFSLPRSSEEDYLSEFPTLLFFSIPSVLS